MESIKSINGVHPLNLLAPSQSAIRVSRAGGVCGWCTGPSDEPLHVHMGRGRTRGTEKKTSLETW